jgi:hypothetical protein
VNSFVVSLVGHSGHLISVPIDRSASSIAQLACPLAAVAVWLAGGRGLYASADNGSRCYGKIRKLSGLKRARTTITDHWPSVSRSGDSG